MKNTAVRPTRLEMEIKMHDCKIHKSFFIQGKCPYCQHNLMNDDWE